MIDDVDHNRNLLAIAFAGAMRLSGEFEMAARGGVDSPGLSKREAFAMYGESID